MITGILFVQAVAFAVLSGIVASNKNREPFGWAVIGFVFGLFGFIATVAVRQVEEETRSSSKQSARNEGRSQKKEQVSSRKDQSPSAARDFNPDEHDKKCPACAEYIKLEAQVCRYCGHEFTEEEVEQQLEQVKEEVKEEKSRGEWECRCGALNSGEDDLCPDCGRSPDAVI